jgi:hypothetical protein
VTNRKFKIVENSYWTDSGCSCCDADIWPYYEVYEILPDSTEVEVHTNGTAHEIEDAYHGILTHLGVDVEVVYEV